MIYTIPQDILVSAHVIDSHLSFNEHEPFMYCDTDVK